MPNDVISLGTLYPSYSAEDDFPAIASVLGTDVQIHVVHTSIGEDAHREDALRDTGDVRRLLVGAEQLKRYHPDAAMWACTSGSFVFGLAGARRQVELVQSALGVPVSSTSLAFAEAARALGLQQVAIAATYPEDVTQLFVDFLTEAGIEVVSASSEGIIRGADVGTLPKDEVLTLVADGDHPDAAAVLLPDTALHTVRWLEELEITVGKPVLTANQVTAWSGLRLAGWNRRAEMLGSLFRSTSLSRI